MDFFWGVATSGYQSEGGYNGPDEPKNNWAESERRGLVARTGRAAEFWTRYADDFATSRKLGLNAFRLGIEWARVQPSTRTEASSPPPFDEIALDGYAERIAACRLAGLEPVVTLQHFTHPAWLGPDAWLDSETVGHFGRYVQAAVAGVNRRLVERHGVAPIRVFITINEPNILVQNTYLATTFPARHRTWANGVAALNHLLAAHVRAYNIVHDIYSENGWEAPEVSLNTFCSDSYWSDQMNWDLLTLRELDAIPQDLVPFFRKREKELFDELIAARLPLRNGFFVLMGRLVHSVIVWLAPKFFNSRAFAFLLHEIQASPRRRLFDFVGMDYYDPFSAHMFRPPSFRDLEFPTRSLHAWLMDGMTSKWWNWIVLPEGMHFFCKRYASIYGRPVLIAENGMALRRKADNSHATGRRDKYHRSQYLEMHVREVIRLLEDGCPLMGYLHWSLTDNYEWGSFSPRFGLFTIDYAKGADRLVEDHLGDRPSETYARLIREAKIRLEPAEASASRAARCS